MRTLKCTAFRFVGVVEVTTEVMEFNSTQLTYLDALGIDVWMPRDQSALDAAIADTQVQSATQAGTSQSASVGSSNSTSNRAAAMAAATELLNGSQSSKNSQPEAAVTQAAPAANPIPVVQSAPPVAEPKAQAPTQPIQQPSQQEGQDASTINPAPYFTLQFWCYSSGFWFVSAYQGIRPEHHKFVHNLALYLQGPSQGKKRKPKHVGVFSWPMIDAPNIDQSESVARTYLSQHIQQLQQMSPADKFIALDDSHHWLPSENRICLDTQLDNALSSSTEKLRIWQILQAHRLS